MERSKDKFECNCGNYNKDLKVEFDEDGAYCPDCGGYCVLVKKPIKDRDIIRNKCCDKWDRWGAVEDKEHKGFFIYVYFCPECGTQLKDKTCPYNKTTSEQIIACVMDCYDCYDRRFATEIYKK